MRSEQGFTLVELLVVITLIGAIIAISFTTYAFGNKAFQAGKQRSSLQTEISQVAHYITKELRNITEEGLELLDLDNLEMSDDFQYIYLKDQAIYHQDQQSIQLSSAIIENLVFEAVEHDRGILLKFKIKGTDQKHEFSINSQVLLNNVRRLTTPEVEGSAIKFQKVVR